LFRAIHSRHHFNAQYIHRLHCDSFVGHRTRMRNTALTIVLCLLLAAPTARADVLTRIPTNDRVVALTFDACEAAEPMAFDRGVLDYLVARRIPFTVFASGKFVESNLADIQTLAQWDFVDIENHSWNHPNTMNRFSSEVVLDQVARAHDAITAATGRAPQFFRFPAGNFNEAGLRAVETLGYRVVHWRWPTGDPDPHETANRLFGTVMTNVAPGDILIFHINGRGVHTAEALPRIVEQLEADGYRFALISDYIGHPRQRTAPLPFQTSAARRQFDNWIELAPLRAMPGALD
jgi:peptidoglycan-N-acetylglucosamine deacetylase